MTTKIDILKLKAKAAMGNVEAMFLLGNNYLFGLGIDVDIELAHSWLLKAAEKGFDVAKGTLENSFADNGRSIHFTKEFSEIYEGVKALCQAADKGDPAALHIKGSGKITDETYGEMKLSTTEDVEESNESFVPYNEAKETVDPTPTPTNPGTIDPNDKKESIEPTPAPTGTGSAASVEKITVPKKPTIKNKYSK